MALQQQVFSTGDYAWKSWSNGYVISLTLTEESVDTVNNTSQVAYLFTISNTNNNRFVSNDYSWSIFIGGHSIAINHFNFNLASNYTTQTIASGCLTVQHNSDGTLAMPYEVSIPNVQKWTSYGPPAMGMSGVWALTTIQSAPPTISNVSVVDGNSITLGFTGNPNKLVRYYSNAVVTATATAHNGAQITAFEVLCADGKSIASKTGTLSGTLYGVEKGSFTFKATDSLGNTTISSLELPLLEYVRPTCVLSDNKPDINGNITVQVSGSYFSGSFGAKVNHLTVQYRYKKKGTSWLDTEEEWHDIPVAMSGNSYTAQGELSGLDYRISYIFQARTIDQLAVVTSSTYTARALTVFDWGENDFCFHVPVSGITADMVGARYVATSGSRLLELGGVQSGLLFISDAGNVNNYYLGVFHGYQWERTPGIQSLGGNTLEITISNHGSVTVKNAQGALTFVVIPLVSL